MSKQEEYKNLIEKFLEKKISTSEFERTYLDIFQEGNEYLSEKEFNILDGLFFYVDCYTDLPITPEDNPDFTINEEQLREHAKEALQKLRALE